MVIAQLEKYTELCTVVDAPTVQGLHSPKKPVCVQKACITTKPLYNPKKPV